MTISKAHPAIFIAVVLGGVACLFIFAVILFKYQFSTPKSQTTANQAIPNLQAALDQAGYKLTWTTTPGENNVGTVHLGKDAAGTTTVDVLENATQHIIAVYVVTPNNTKLLGTILNQVEPSLVTNGWLNKAIQAKTMSGIIMNQRSYSLTYNTPPAGDQQYMLSITVQPDSFRSLK